MCLIAAVVVDDVCGDGVVIVMKFVDVNVIVVICLACLICVGWVVVMVMRRIPIMNLLMMMTTSITVLGEVLVSLTVGGCLQPLPGVTLLVMALILILGVSVLVDIGPGSGYDDVDIFVVVAAAAIIAIAVDGAGSDADVNFVMVLTM